MADIKALLKMMLAFLNLKGVISQRLLPGLNGKQVLTTEFLPQSAYVTDMIQKGHRLSKMQSKKERMSACRFLTIACTPCTRKGESVRKKP